MNGWIKWLAMLLLLTGLYRNRYRIFNAVLGYGLIRKWAVTAAMRIPGIRSRFIQSAFQ
ncbi:hypothetical protein BpJC7_08590 [Weizmannia acidilactici]|uniref:Uncharacterized protein n=1 Tax=Weizmannia acidilactici TaxID=2607726 RepID=A0A5J4J3L4_9BACI|nr:hypothetical protein [Weizmannia acidilactici]GER66903.1 hypothetical protein BpJC4_13740 [Weizmannia acidilactici]GER69556.1 hypothetical protein BpJC7_08590 [Weizmannia acidilactici]GER72767.1 hypothetical protein BpPP18_08340 [Weizmannia acidilactici]